MSDSVEVSKHELVNKQVEQQVQQKLSETPNQNKKENDRISNLLKSVGTSNVGELVKKLEPAYKVFLKVLEFSIPIIQTIYTYSSEFYKKLPIDILTAFFGLILAFFGGSYAVVISAAEAFYASGYEKFKTNFDYLYTEIKILWKKSREDDKEDKDGDGVPDVQQISVNQLVMRKIAFVFANCKDPEKMMEMAEGILAGFASVIAVLKLEFAKVIALGASIGNMLRKPACYFLVPIASTVLPKQYHQWISPLINLFCKIISITIAWTVQRVISSLQSGIRGGLLFSRSILKYLNEKGYIKFNDEESYLDEVLGWSIAVVGVFLQLRYGFRVPFPLNILLFPVSILENILVWIISK